MGNLQIILNSNDKDVLDEIVKYLKTLSVQEQYELSYFLKGVNFAKSIKDVDRGKCVEVGK